MEFCNTDTGNVDDGYDVNHSLNSLCVIFGSGDNSSQCLSNEFIQLTYKWQFCSITHPPTGSAALIYAFALTSEPLPIDTIIGSLPIVLAKFINWLVGSEPADNIKHSGITDELSS